MADEKSDSGDLPAVDETTQKNYDEAAAEAAEYYGAQAVKILTPLGYPELGWRPADDLAHATVFLRLLCEPEIREHLKKGPDKIYSGEVIHGHRPTRKATCTSWDANYSEGHILQLIFRWALLEPPGSPSILVPPKYFDEAGPGLETEQD